MFELGDDGAKCRLTCRYRDKVIQAEEDDYFEALFQIRLRLDLDGLLPFCYGASGRVYPEGTVIEMSRGLIACKIKMGQPPKETDLVNIFADGHDVVPAFPQMQQECWDAWLASLPS